MKKKSVEFTLKAEKMDFPIEKIRSTQDAYNYARKFYFDDINIYESVFIVLLNQANNTIGYAKISQGGVNSCLVDKRSVSKYAIESLINIDDNLSFFNDVKIFFKTIFSVLKSESNENVGETVETKK